jgi:hypothetical protein
VELRVAIDGLNDCGTHSQATVLEITINGGGNDYYDISNVVRSRTLLVQAVSFDRK